jgi:hypothetical protein
MPWKSSAWTCSPTCIFAVGGDEVEVETREVGVFGRDEDDDSAAEVAREMEDCLRYRERSRSYEVAEWTS